MTIQQKRNDEHRRQILREMKHRPLMTNLCEAVLRGQRLRANETVIATTISLNYAAKWRHAVGGAR